MSREMDAEYQMTYEKCWRCEHMEHIYLTNNDGSDGLVLICKITGQSIWIIECVKAVRKETAE